MQGQSLRFEAIGTQWQIELYDEITVDKFHKLRGLVEQRIDEFDRVYSRFRADSTVSEIAQTPGKYVFPSDATELIDLYRRLYALTDGAVTPLIGGMMSEAGYDSEYSFRPRPIQPVLKWEEVMSFDGGILTTNRAVQLDFGAAGKGYLVDLVAELLEAEGVYSYLINAGGDMRHRGSSPVRVGLEDPYNTKQAIGVFELSNESLCASAVNRRAWGEYHHIMNPKTGRSEDGVVATWVVAGSTALADILATALFFCEPHKLVEQFDFEYAIIRSNNQLIASPKFADAMFK